MEAVRASRNFGSLDLLGTLDTLDTSVAEHLLDTAVPKEPSEPRDTVFVGPMPLAPLPRQGHRVRRVRRVRQVRQALWRAA